MPRTAFAVVREVRQSTVRCHSSPRFAARVERQAWVFRSIMRRVSHLLCRPFRGSLRRTGGSSFASVSTCTSFTCTGSVEFASRLFRSCVRHFLVFALTRADASTCKRFHSHPIVHLLWRGPPLSCDPSVPALPRDRCEVVVTRLGPRRVGPSTWGRTGVRDAPPGVEPRGQPKHPGLKKGKRRKPSTGTNPSGTEGKGTREQHVDNAEPCVHRCGCAWRAEACEVRGSSGSGAIRRGWGCCGGGSPGKGRARGRTHPPNPKRAVEHACRNRDMTSRR